MSIGKRNALVNKNWTLKLYFLHTIWNYCTAAYVSLYCLGVRYPSVYAGRSPLKNFIYASISSGTFSPCRWKSVNSSGFIHSLIDSIAALPAGVPARGMEYMMPQHGADAKECYQVRFYSYGLFGLLDEWIKRGFKESPDEMVQIFYQMIDNEIEIIKKDFRKYWKNTFFTAVIIGKTI